MEESLYSSFFTSSSSCTHLLIQKDSHNVWKRNQQSSSSQIPHIPINKFLSSINKQTYFENIKLWHTIPNTISIHKNVEPNQYEGGYKIWEGSNDLIDYLLLNHYDFSKKSVLELGCGHALPSMLALHKGAKRIILQDLNEDVLRNVTLSNVILNTSHILSCFKETSDGHIKYKNQIKINSPKSFEHIWLQNINIPTTLPQHLSRINKKRKINSKTEELTNKDNAHDKSDSETNNSNKIRCRCLLLAASWEEMCKEESLLKIKESFERPLKLKKKHEPRLTAIDYILSSECLYRTENYPYLVECLHNMLSIGGIALFSAKRFYFGLDGGILTFQDYIEKNNSKNICKKTYKFHSSIVHSFVEKTSNIRDILKVEKISL